MNAMLQCSCGIVYAIGPSVVPCARQKPRAVGQPHVAVPKLTGIRAERHAREEVDLRAIITHGAYNTLEVVKRMRARRHTRSNAERAIRRLIFRGEIHRPIPGGALMSA